MTLNLKYSLLDRNKYLYNNTIYWQGGIFFYKKENGKTKRISGSQFLEARKEGIICG